MGDELSVIRNDEEILLKIVGIYPSFKQYGNSIRLLTPDIQEFFGNLADGYYSVVLKEGEDANAFAAKMSEEFDDFNFFPMERSTARSVNMLLPPIMTGMILFALIFFLILLCMIRLMMIECSHEIEMYYYLGFSARKIKQIVRQRFGIPVILGTVIAIPLSLFVVPGWMHPLAGRLGLMKIPMYPSVWLVVMAVMGILVCGFASMAVFLKRYKVI